MDTSCGFAIKGILIEVVKQGKVDVNFSVANW